MTPLAVFVPTRPPPMLFAPLRLIVALAVTCPGFVPVTWPLLNPTSPPAVAMLPLIVVLVTLEFWTVPGPPLMPIRPPRRMFCEPAPLPAMVPVVWFELVMLPSFAPTRPPTDATAEEPLTFPVELPPLIEAPFALKPTRPPTDPPPMTLPLADNPQMAVLFCPIGPPTKEFVPPLMAPAADELPLIAPLLMPTSPPA